jgi:hypothetical protein
LNRGAQVAAFLCAGLLKFWVKNHSKMVTLRPFDLMPLPPRGRLQIAANTPTRAIAAI